MPLSITRSIVLSGSSRGIGRAIALRFAREGFHVAFYASTAENVSLLDEELKAANSNIRTLAITCDAADALAVQAFGRQVLAAFRHVDVLVNNAGNFTPHNVSDAAEGDFERIMAVNLHSHYHLTRTLLPGIVRTGSGYIFNMCSTASLSAYPAGNIYAISKHAMLGFSRALRQELRTDRIRVSSIMPGATFTDSWADAGLPEERFMPAEDVAELVWQAYALNPRTVLEDIVLRPLEGDV
jgi:NAD(P)-dependent dehydrogenase (short-subunit alcohol dehydrogenase family)